VIRYQQKLTSERPQNKMKKQNYITKEKLRLPEIKPKMTFKLPSRRDRLSEISKLWEQEALMKEIQVKNCHRHETK